MHFRNEEEAAQLQPAEEEAKVSKPVSKKDAKSSSKKMKEEAKKRRREKKEQKEQERKDKKDKNKKKGDKKRFKLSKKKAAKEEKEEEKEEEERKEVAEPPEVGEKEADKNEKEKEAPEEKKEEPKQAASEELKKIVAKRHLGYLYLFFIISLTSFFFSEMLRRTLKSRSSLALIRTTSLQANSLTFPSSFRYSKFPFGVTQIASCALLLLLGSLQFPFHPIQVVLPARIVFFIFIFLSPKNIIFRVYFGKVS